MTAPIVAEHDNDPARVCGIISKQLDVWQEIEDVLGGTRELRKKAKDKYLPQHPGEKDPNYQRRVKRMRLFPAFKETIEGCTGIVFREPPKLDPKTSADLLHDAEDIDGMGNSLEIFGRRLFWQGLAKGWHGILVDMPVIENPERTSGINEKYDGVRPYWSMIHGSQVLNVDAIWFNGRYWFRQLVIRYDLTRRKGRFGEEQYCLIKEWLVMPSGRVAWLTWEQNENKKWVATGHKGLLQNCTRIPFVPFYAGRFLAPLHAEPPLDELLITNLNHMRLDTNFETSLEVGLGPILWTRGRGSTDALVVGPFATIDLTDPNGQVGYAEPTGASWSAAQERLKEYKNEEAAMGLAMLQRETRQAETVEAKRMDKEEQHSKLAVAAIGFKDALEDAWSIHAEFKKKPAPSVLLSIDFERLEMPAEEIRVWSERVSAGQLSLQTFWQMLVEGRKLPEDFKPELELQRLADEAARLMPPEKEPPPTGEEDDEDPTRAGAAA